MSGTFAQALHCQSRVICRHPRMPRFQDLTGQRFGCLLVVAGAARGRYGLAWSCLCDCGNAKVVHGRDLRGGHTRSCGCLQRDRISELRTTHAATIGGLSLTYKVWKSVKRRCFCETDAAYPRYGGRGITMCERWRNSFENFLADMGERPSRAHSIDRYPNNDGSYEPGNCRWATAKEQSRNSRKCKTSVDAVREVLGRIEHGEPPASVAERLRMPLGRVQDIARGRCWKDIYAEGKPCQV